MKRFGLKEVKNGIKHTICQIFVVSLQLEIKANIRNINIKQIHNHEKDYSDTAGPDASYGNGQ